MKYVDEALQLSQMGETPITVFGTCTSYFMLSLVTRLTDAISEDWKSPSTWSENKTMTGSGIHGKEDDADEKEHIEKAEKSNSIRALELVAKIMQNKRTAALLRIARRIL
jgi:hypothetical protein